MNIYTTVRFTGKRNTILRKALIDTGAEISLVPFELAIKIGAYKTGQNIDIQGIHGQIINLPMGKMKVTFPNLGNIGGDFIIVVSETESTPIIGMDIMRPLGINIETKTKKLSVNNEIWEAFKTLSGIGVIMIAGAIILEKIFGE